MRNLRLSDWKEAMAAAVKLLPDGEAIASLETISWKRKGYISFALKIKEIGGGAGDELK